MGIVGAILGDIAGSRFEFSPVGEKRRNHDYQLFTPNNYFTDDTVLTVACKDAILHKDPVKGVDFAKYYDLWGNKYDGAGYGGQFLSWLKSDTKHSYGSFGNGAAMRCSFCGEVAKSEDECDELAEASALCTHDHPEGIKGAVTLSRCVYMAKNKASKEDILKYGIMQYPAPTGLRGMSHHGMTGNGYTYSPEVPTSEYIDTIDYEISCQGSVPVAVRCFYETESFEDCMYLINSMNIDTDTVGAIAGAISHSYYGECTGMDKQLLKYYLPEEMFKIVYP